MQQFNLLVDSANSRLNAGVCRPYLIAVHAELSHGSSFGWASLRLATQLRNCGELRDRQGHAESGSTAESFVGDDFTLVAFNSGADN